MINNFGAHPKEDLSQLWRRIIFNIAISNTDDHLRNHGFLLTKKGWVLSPAYDLNPSTDKCGLHLNITDNDNSLDYQLAFEVIPFFKLKSNEAKSIYDEVLSAVSQWENIAKNLKINRTEILMKQAAFRI